MLTHTLPVYGLAFVVSFCKMNWHKHERTLREFESRQQRVLIAHPAALLLAGMVARDGSDGDMK